MDGKAYEVPDLKSCGYKLYRSLWKWWRVGYRNICEGEIDSDSPCCLCETLLYLFSLLYPFALFFLTFASCFIYIDAKSRENSYSLDPKPAYFTAFCVLVPTVMSYLIPVLCFGYSVLYMLKFTRLVERNFNLVPRNRVFSNMIYFRNLNMANRYL